MSTVVLTTIVALGLIRNNGSKFVRQVVFRLTVRRFITSDWEQMICVDYLIFKFSVQWIVECTQVRRSILAWSLYSSWCTCDARREGAKQFCVSRRLARGPGCEIQRFRASTAVNLQKVNMSTSFFVKGQVLCGSKAFLL